MERLKEYIFKEIVYARGCTEPASVAFAVARTVSYFGNRDEVEKINIDVSNSIYKNGVDVGIPGTKKRGNLFAAAVGLISGDPEKELEVLSGIDEETILKAEKVIESKKITLKCFCEITGVYLKVTAYGGGKTVELTIEGGHTNVVLVKINDEKIFEKDKNEISKDYFSGKTPEDIIRFTENTEDDYLEYIYEKAKTNYEAALYAIENKDYTGCEYIKKLTECKKRYDEKTIKLLVTAASMARMGGAPVRITSCYGSGNQGIVSLVPIFFYGNKKRISKKQISKALILSCLITGLIKSKIGKLVPLCGVFYAAGVGAASGIYCLMNKTINEKDINLIINNYYSQNAGVLCDGAKETCALKAGSAAREAFEVAELTLNSPDCFSDMGIAGRDFEETVNNLKIINEKSLKDFDKTMIEIIDSKGE